MSEGRTRSEMERDREMLEIHFATEEDCRIVLERFWNDDVPLDFGGRTHIRLRRQDFETLPASSREIYERAISAGVVTRPAGPAPQRVPESRRRMLTPEEASELSGQYAERRRLRREGR